MWFKFAGNVTLKLGIRARPEVQVVDPLVHWGVDFFDFELFGDNIKRKNISVTETNDETQTLIKQYLFSKTEIISIKLALTEKFILLHVINMIIDAVPHFEDLNLLGHCIPWALWHKEREIGAALRDLNEALMDARQDMLSVQGKLIFRLVEKLQD